MKLLALCCNNVQDEREARALGYEIGVVFIATENPSMNLMRMVFRREEQNRDVPAAAVLRRFERSLNQVSKAVALSDIAYVYDNTGRDFAKVVQCRDGRVVWCAESVPSWAQRALAPQLADYSRVDR